MPLKSSEAFIIDVRKLREADRLVVLFTEDEGKVKGVAVSAARSRKRFGGKLERLSRVRASWFDREGRELARIDSCDLLDESFSLHQDLTAAAVLSYVAELVDTFAHERESDRRFFRLLKSLLAALRGGGPPLLLARYFEIWTLRLHGLLPDLDRCGACGRNLAGSGAWVSAGDAPAAFCPGCRKQHGGESPGRLSAAALAALDLFRRHAPTELVKVAFPPPVMAEIETFAGGRLIAFLGQPLRSFRFLKEIETP